jgi:hypothetical protein
MFKAMKRIIYFLVAAALLGGCAEEKEVEQRGSIYGVVTDKATGEVIRAAGVQLSTGVKTVTGNDGQYEFTELKAGEYTLQVSKTGYTELVGHKITVEPNKTAKGDVQMEKLPAALRIVNDNGKDIDKLDFGNAVSDITRMFNIFNDSPEPLEWKITAAATWIKDVSKTDGTLNAGKTQGVIITIDRESLLEGANVTTIHVTSDNGNKAVTIVAVKGDVLSNVVILTTTDLMVQKADIGQGDWSTANSMCENSTLDGFTDWRLPTKAELAVLYNERNAIGGFQVEYYWSSTTDSYNYHWVQYFGITGGQSTQYNRNEELCRCVRTLP